MNYFKAAEALHENWQAIVDSGKYAPKQLEHLKDVIDNPAMYQKTDDAILDYAAEVRAGNAIADLYLQHLKTH